MFFKTLALKKNTINKNKALDFVKNGGHSEPSISKMDAWKEETHTIWSSDSTGISSLGVRRV